MSNPNLDSRYTKPADVDAKIAAQAVTDAGQYAQQWKANNSYAANQIVIAPDGSIVQAITGFTSNSSYSASNWTILSPTVTNISSGYLPKWQQNFSYTTGYIVLNPSGQIVSANNNFTSGSTYSSSNWTIIPGSVSSVAGRTGDILLSKSDVGLANVTNTADLDKPVSTLTQAALDTKAGTADVQVFVSSGTWTKPTGARFVHVVCIGAGGGGGAGRRGASGTAWSGGGGGGSAGYSLFSSPAAALPATVSVTVGAGGAGGISQSNNDTNGANGASGQVSLFGPYCRANPGNGGGGGSASNGAQGSSGTGVIASGAAGGLGQLGAAGLSAAGNLGASAGGAGGGISSTPSAFAGGAGGQNFTTNITAGGGAIGNNGVAGDSQLTNAAFCGGGGGGGGSSITGAGGSGGAAGSYGAGGGGGGASLNGNASGAGGNGGSGIIVVTSW